MLHLSSRRVALMLMGSTSLLLLFATSIKAQGPTNPPPVYFHPAVNYDAGYKPATITKGDFNGDGKLDLAVANWFGYAVRVLFGTGNGTFPTTSSFAVQDNPFQVTSGDFNNDGKIDLVTANGGGDSASVLLGNGNGTFQSEIRTPVGTTPYGVATGDINGDGKLDIVIANRDGNSVNVMLGQGDGTFQTPVSYAAGQGGFRVILQDLNHDNKLDIAVTNFDSNTVSVLLGTGTGTFAPATNYPVGIHPRGVVAGDLNGDGKLDLVVGNNGSNTISMLLGDGAGGFASAVNSPAGVGPNAVAIGDLNGDKILDLAVSSHVNYVSVLLGNGDATFQQPISYNTSSNSSDVVIGDFNSDGLPDLATSNFQDNNLSILLQSSTPIATPTATPSPTSTPTPTAIPVDTTPPVADGLTINNGALTTTSLNVTLRVSATDSEDPQYRLRMSFSNNGQDWSTWRQYASTTSWQLLTGDGAKTVYARFADRAGNVSETVSDTITLDTAVQTEYGVTINQGALYTNQVTVTLTVSAKPGTTEMQVSNDGGFYGVSWEPYASKKTWQITQYNNTVIPRVVYVRYRDSNSLVSSTYQDDIILDSNAPSGKVSIEEAADTSSSNTTTLNLSATDDLSGVGSMRLSGEPDFTAVQWESFTSTREWNTKQNPSVYVQFRDNAGNVSPTYMSSLGSRNTILLPVVKR